MFQTLPDADALAQLLDVGSKGLAIEASGVLIGVNRTLLRYLQRDRSDVIGRPLTEFVMGQPESLPTASGSCQVVLETRDGEHLIVEVTTRSLRIAGQSAAAIILADLSERQRSEQRLAAQYSVTRVLSQAQTLSQGTYKILEVICECLDWDVGALWTIDPEADRLQCSHLWHRLNSSVNEFEAESFASDLARGIGLPGRVWESGRLVYMADVSRSPNFPRAESATRAGLRSGFGLPIVGAHGVHGVLEFFTRQVHPADPELLEMLRAIGSQIGQHMEHKREQEELDQFFRLSPDLLCVAGYDGYFKRVNPAWETALGWTREELLGRPYLEFVHPDDRPVTGDEHAMLSTSSHDTKAFENRYLCKDGSYKWFEWSARARPDLKKIFGLARDLTARRQGENKVIEANRFLDSVVENLPNMLFVKDAKTLSFIRLNRAGERLLGWSRDQLLGRTDREFFPPEQAAFFDATDRSVLAGKKLVEVLDEPIQTRDKGERYLRTKKIPLLGPDGEPQYLLGISEDITEWKRTQDELDRLARQNELILSSVGEGIYGVDIAGCATFINPAAAMMIGWEVADVIGKPMHELIHHSKVSGERISALDCPIYAAFRDGTVHRVHDDVFWRKDGSWFPVEYVSTPIRARGVTIGAVVAFRDITERQAIDRMKEEFISVASHELRTPLTSIRGALGILATGRLGKLAPKGQRMVEIAIGSTDRLVRLTNDMLDLERVRSGLTVIDKRSCDGITLLDQSVNDMRGMAQKYEIDLVASGQPVRILAVPDQIIQTLTNLLSNAIKFSQPGGTVSATLETHDDEALFAVRDRGRGIPNDKLEAVFGRFTQLDASDSRSRGGTGLGLTICRSIVMQHGGRIWAESVVGSGTTFFFTIPLVPAGYVSDHDLLEQTQP